MSREVPRDVAIAMRDSVAQLVENGGAEAVLICFTRHKRGQTETFAVPYGNLHCVRGLAEYAYGKMCEGIDEEELDDDDDGDDDDDSQEGDPE